MKPPPVRFSGFLVKTLIGPDTQIDDHFFRIETVFGEALLHVRHCRRHGVDIRPFEEGHDVEFAVAADLREDMPLCRSRQVDQDRMHVAQACDEGVQRCGGDDEFVDAETAAEVEEADELDI